MQQRIWKHTWLCVTRIEVVIDRDNPWKKKKKTMSIKYNSCRGNEQSFLIEQFLYDLGKWFRQVFFICFISQWMKRSTHGLFVFPPKKTLIWRKHCSTGQSYSNMTSNSINGWFLESPQAFRFFTRAFA